MQATVTASPLAPGVSPVRVHYRECGGGAPLIILHGGWGYEVYPFDQQVAALSRSHRIVIPDRTGYGGSLAIHALPADYHQRAAEETLALMDALQISQAALWGHSDGAVIALRLALAAPARVRRVVAEATHFLRRKPGSRLFFETMRTAPETFGERVVSALERDHGDRWRSLLALGGGAWLAIADEAPSADADLYDGCLGRLSVPTLFVHGAKDPRTEPGELDRLRIALGSAPFTLRVFDDGGHSPHSERATADAVTAAAREFLA